MPYNSSLPPKKLSFIHPGHSHSFHHRHQLCQSPKKSYVRVPYSITNNSPPPPPIHQRRCCSRFGVVFASLSRTMHTFCKQIIDKQHQQIQQQTANNSGAVAEHTTHTHTACIFSLRSSRCMLHWATNNWTGNWQSTAYLFMLCLWRFHLSGWAQCLTSSSRTAAEQSLRAAWPLIEHSVPVGPSNRSRCVTKHVQHTFTFWFASVVFVDSVTVFFGSCWWFRDCNL